MCAFEESNVVYLRALYAFLAANILSTICSSLVRIPLDTMSKRPLESESICIGIERININSGYFRIVSTSS